LQRLLDFLKVKFEALFLGLLKNRSGESKALHLKSDVTHLLCASSDKAPASNNIVSARVVFPKPECPNRTAFEIIRRSKIFNFRPPDNNKRAGVKRSKNE
jgi:hypothetical protein